MEYETIFGRNNVPSIERLPVHGGLLPKINIALLVVPILAYDLQPLHTHA
jgi:hypothetical protein